jgi:hypothetical protein
MCKSLPVFVGAQFISDGACKQAIRKMASRAIPEKVHLRSAIHLLGLAYCRIREDWSMFYVGDVGNGCQDPPPRQKLPHNIGKSDADASAEDARFTAPPPRASRYCTCKMGGTPDGHFSMHPKRSNPRPRRRPRRRRVRSCRIWAMSVISTVVLSKQAIRKVVPS